MNIKTKEMPVEEIKRLKKKYGLSNAQLSDESSVPLGTVNKVLGGATETPRSETLAALAIPLREREAEEQKTKSCTYPSLNKAPADSLLMEEAIAYGVPEHRIPGTFTIDDYYNLPDEHRVELIDGYFYDMAAPTTIHQSIALTMAFRIKSFIDSRKGSCIPFISPVDVILNLDDNKTIVQPDVIVVCDPSKVKKKRIEGAPDFVLEVISPSTATKDEYKKMAKYQQSGVREYWIIDPIKKMLLVYYFGWERPFLFTPLEGKISVAIFNDELEIDLGEIGALCT